MAEGAVIPMVGRVACVFCDIVAGRVEASRVYEDDFVLAFLDNAPINPGHMLVIPRAHYASLSDLPEAVGQEVFHCHLHVLLRFRGDSFRVGHGSPVLPPRREHDAVARRISAAYGEVFPANAPSVG